MPINAFNAQVPHARVQPAYSKIVNHRADLFSSATGREVIGILREAHFSEWCVLVTELLQPFEQGHHGHPGRGLNPRRRGAVLAVYLSNKLGHICVKFQSCKDKKKFQQKICLSLYFLQKITALWGS